MITATTTSVIWRRLDQPGHDSARLAVATSGAVIEGTAVFHESARPCRLDYRVECDTDGRTVSARVRGWLGVSSIALDIAADLDRACEILDTVLRRMAMHGRVILCGTLATANAVEPYRLQHWER